MKQRIPSIDLLRGLVILLMVLDHVRMYFGYGTWYSEPTNLATTTPLLFFTRWVTHFCAPAFVFLAGTSAYLSGRRKTGKRELSQFLLTRGLWLIFIELVIVNFAWTFDITYSFRILQVIWAIGISMVVLSGLVYLPHRYIFGIGAILVLGHNILDSITASGNKPSAILWDVLHQQKSISLGSGNIIDIVYPVLPWIGVMALGYVLGVFYEESFDSNKRRRWLLGIGASLILAFILLRGFNLYGEPNPWNEQGTFTFSLISFLNTTKYPPSLQFLLMTLGPALIFLSVFENAHNRLTSPIITFGKIPFFFYIVHLYFIHALAMLYLAYTGHDWHEYILSAGGIRSGALINFGVGVEAVYGVWIIVLVMLYPACKWYRSYKESHPELRRLSYL